MNKKQRVKNIDEYKKRKKNRYKKRKIKRIIKRILITFAIVAVIIINLCGNAVVTNYKYKLNALEKELRKEEIALDQLKMENLQNSSITNVEQKAKDKLGMDYPNKNQTRYIDG
ncbi:MAG: cell division protein FtsL [Clostridium sp.]|nr:cell division protein FtsL [Clostridium sp.]